MVDFESIALWTTIATWVLAVGTLAALYWQTRQAGKLNSANAVINLRAYPITEGQGSSTSPLWTTLL